MENSNYNASNCGRATELMSYLYGELGIDESRGFETHLGACRSCAAETAEFAGIRGSFAEIRADFERLPTPLIEIPYRVREVTSEPVSILESIRAFLGGFPAVAVGSAAALLIFLGLGFYLLTADHGSDIAGGNQNPTKAIASPTVEPTVSRTTETAKSETGPADAPARTAPVPVKASDKRVVTEQKSRQEPRRKASEGGKKPSRSAPTLFDEGDEEDDTLRLADLFGDVGTK